MNCPDLDTIGRHVDRLLSPGEAQRLDAHIADCPRCADEAQNIAEIEVALKDHRAWQTPSRCIAPGDLLLVLSGSGEPLLHVHQHVTQCVACQAELTNLSDALLQHERGELERPTASLKARLRRLRPEIGSTTIDDVKPESTSRRVSDSRLGRTTTRIDRITGKLSSQKLPTVDSSPSSSSSSGTRRASRRQSGQSARRRASVKLAAVRPPSPFGPTWAWAAMSAAAAVLVALAIVLTPSRPREVARAPEPRGGAGRSGPLVSDAMARPQPQRPQPATTEVDSTYPLPAELADALPPDETPPPFGRPDPSPEPPSPEPVVPAPASDPAPLPAQPPTTVDGSRTRTPPTGTGAAPEATPVVSAPPSAAPEAERFADDGGRVELALTRLSGFVSIVRQDGPEGAESLQRGQGTISLRPGDRLRVRPGTNGAFVSLDDGAYEVCLEQGTQIVVRSAAGGPVLGLERGRLLAEVVALPADRHFVIATAQGTFSVLGTVFGVEVDGAQSRLTVAEGLVEAHSTRGQAQVAAGQGVSIATGEAPGEVRPADLGRLSWARGLQARREVLYSARFDDARGLGGFQGEVVNDRTFLDSAGALVLEPATDNRYWGLVARAPAHRLRAFRAAPDVYVQFTAWAEKSTKLLFQTLNETQNKEFKRGLSDIPAGRWKTYTIPLMELTTYFDPGKTPMRENDLLIDLEIFAGEPGDAHRVLLDEVVVFRKVYD